MQTRGRQTLRIRLSILDAGRPIERIVELEGNSRLETLHHLIQDLFTWTDEARHNFTDRRSSAGAGQWSGMFSRQRVWEMNHGCHDHEHVSMCEWTSSVAEALDACVDESGKREIFYEYAVAYGRDKHDYFDGCLLETIGECDDARAHGWTVAIELLSQRKSCPGDVLPALLDGRGHSPFEEMGGAIGDAVLNAVLDDPSTLTSSSSMIGLASVSARGQHAKRVPLIRISSTPPLSRSGARICSIAPMCTCSRAAPGCLPLS